MANGRNDHVNTFTLPSQSKRWKSVAMVYEPLYHALEIATIKSPSGYSCQALCAKRNRQDLPIFLDDFY